MNAVLVKHTLLFRYKDHLFEVQRGPDRDGPWTWNWGGFAGSALSQSDARNAAKQCIKRHTEPLTE